MRRVLAAVLSVVALLGFLVVDASAQAPTSKVTISGQMDYVNMFTKNHSAVDSNFGRGSETEWSTRTRLRPDITGELGTTKLVLGIEIDYSWGTTSGVAAAGGARGTTGGTPLNTDMPAFLELKWGYTEFDIPGIPFTTRTRLGAQPWGSTATYKPGTLATGDFAGAVVTMAFAPNVKLVVGFAQVEEEATGPSDGYLRGEDWALTSSVEITPFKGLDIKPVYAYFRADGATSGASRQARGGLSVSQCTTVGGGAPCYPQGGVENRHTIGVDARWQMGPVYVDPTFMFQFGQREFLNAAGSKVDQDRRAWLADIRAGFQAGPLLAEVGGSYTTGNRANEDIRQGSQDINYYESISQDGGYWGTWCELWCLDVDFNTGLPVSQVSSMGYDKYGRAALAGKLTYAVTPAFSLRGNVMAQWTAQSVDTSSARNLTTVGLTPGDFRGDDRYLGTEIDLGFKWTLAPGLALDVMGAYLFSGHALAARTTTSTAVAGTPAVAGTVRNDSSVDDVMAIAARIRYSF